METNKKETKKDNVQKEIQAIQTELEQMRSAIRRLAEDGRNNLVMISRLQEELSKTKMDIEVAKQQKKTGPTHDNSITRYE